MRCSCREYYRTGISCPCILAIKHYHTRYDFDVFRASQRNGTKSKYDMLLYEKVYNPDDMTETGQVMKMYESGKANMK